MHAHQCVGTALAQALDPNLTVDEILRPAIDAPALDNALGH
jgi:hypothetical protein